MATETLERSVEAIAQETGLVSLLTPLSYEAREHSKRVANGIFFVANELGLPRDDATADAIKGLTHDSGKGHPKIRELESSGAQLTPQEMIIVNQHTAVGFRMLMELAGKQSDQYLRRIIHGAADVALRHHMSISEVNGDNADGVRLVSIEDIVDVYYGPQRSYMSSKVKDELSSRNTDEVLADMGVPPEGTLIYGMPASEIVVCLRDYTLLQNPVELAKAA